MKFNDPEMLIHEVTGRSLDFLVIGDDTPYTLRYSIMGDTEGVEQYLREHPHYAWRSGMRAAGFRVRDEVTIEELWDILDMRPNPLALAALFGAER
jgi:hypothetical protein